MKTISIVLMIIGILLFLVGIYFDYMQFPDLFRGTISGPIIEAIGVILFFAYKVKK